jgi:CRP-like cAMP-binding protein
MIDPYILQLSGAVSKKYPKGFTIFMEGSFPLYYYQLAEGEVKMNNYNSDGKEFIQSIFSSGQSFGEPPLFIDEPYPANAETLSEAVIWQLPKDDFMAMLQKFPEVSIGINKSLSHRLLYKSVMAPDIASQDPAKRLLTLMSYLKDHQKEYSTVDISFQIPLTRQQLADLTGLRVETVIRTIKQLEKDGKLKIVQRKIYY